jgi:hypothetical protein
MTTTIIILAVMAALIVGFHVGCEATMRAIRSGSRWRLTYPEQAELDRLMGKALAKREGQE